MNTVHPRASPELVHLQTPTKGYSASLRANFATQTEISTESKDRAHRNTRITARDLGRTYPKVFQPLAYGCGPNQSDVLCKKVQNTRQNEVQPICATVCVLLIVLRKRRRIVKCEYTRDPSTLRETYTRMMQAKSQKIRVCFTESSCTQTQ
ncbi:hypothetical protein QE152_g26798 [Popillia japonica]|uniref:Uncharacterized protein n=1 Tax=Popillia japonica TaxID=7064 RepID=A0AAW1JVT9_POPJA